MVGTGIKYNSLRLSRILIKDDLGYDLKWLDEPNRDICNQFVQLYCNRLDIKSLSIERLPLIVPQDYIDKIDPTEGVVLFKNIE